MATMQVSTSSSSSEHKASVSSASSGESNHVTRDLESTNVSARQPGVTIVLVVLLFFIWGFSYGLLSVLNARYQTIFHISQAGAAALQAAYFGAYPVACLTYGRWITHRFGHKTSFVTGLIVFGLGSLAMWPAATKTSFAGICGATFIAASGLATLETAACSYIAICGSVKHLELRSNFAQALNAVGTVLAPVLASHVFFSTGSRDIPFLSAVQWVYLGVAIFAFVVAFAFFLVHMPKPSVSPTRSTLSAEVVVEVSFWSQYRVFHAALAQFCYIGAQVTLATYFIGYVIDIRPSTTASLAASLLAAGQGCFAGGRFVGSFLTYYIKPRWIFLVFTSGMVLFNGICIGAKGNTGLITVMLTFFFQSVCFPMIIATGIKGQGRYTNRATACIVSGMLAGAIVPILTGLLAGEHNSVAYAMIVPTALSIMVWIYAASLNFISSYRVAMDDADHGDVINDHVMVSSPTESQNGQLAVPLGAVAIDIAAVAQLQRTTSTAWIPQLRSVNNVPDAPQIRRSSSAPWVPQMRRVISTPLVPQIRRAVSTPIVPPALQR